MKTDRLINLKKEVLEVIEKVELASKSDSGFGLNEGLLYKDILPRLDLLLQHIDMELKARLCGVINETR